MKRDDPENDDLDENEEEDGDMEAEFNQLTSKENLIHSKHHQTTSPTKLPFFLNCQGEHLSSIKLPFFSNCPEGHLLKCTICSKNRSHFFCENCIKNGDFTSSKQTEIIKERFAEKKLKFIKLQKNIENINQNLSEKLNSNIQLNRLNHELAKYKENKGILQENLNLNRKDINNLVEDYKENESKLVKNKKKNTSLNKKLITLKNNVENKEKLIAEKRKTLNLINESIRQASKEKIFQLTEYIFPITTYNPDENPETGLIYSCESSPLLTFSGESASSSDGREDTEDNEKMVIVEPWLPSNGIYSAYNIYATQHKDLVTSSGGLTDLNSIRTATNRISAALSYTTQLLSVIGFYLDEKFPRKLHFKEFYTNTDQNGRKIYLADDKFAHKVAKLNANILYFCLQQGVDIRLLEPKRTLKNLQLLTHLNPVSIDKAKAYTFSKEAERLVETYLGNDLALSIDEDEFDYNLTGDFERTEDDLNELDWESVPEMPFSSDNLIYSNQNASTNIFSSVVSIFKKII